MGMVCGGDARMRAADCRLCVCGTRACPSFWGVEGNERQWRGCSANTEQLAARELAARLQPTNYIPTSTGTVVRARALWSLVKLSILVSLYGKYLFFYVY